MKGFANLKTAYKLAAGFGICLVLMLVVGVIAWTRMTQLSGISDDLASDPLPGAVALANIDGDSRQLRIYEYRHLSTPDAAGKAQVEGLMRASITMVSDELTQFKKTVRSDEEKRRFDEMSGNWTRYLTEHERFLAVSRSGNQKAGEALLNGDMERLFSDGVAKLVDEMEDANEHDGEALAKQGDQASESAHRLVAILLVSALIMGVFAAWFITRLITHPLAKIGAAAQGLSVGDVQQELAIDTHDEIGQLAGHCRAMIAYQKEMAGVAEAMSVGDVSRSVQPKSDKDVLGNAFSAMIAYQKEMAGVAESMAAKDLTKSVKPKSDKDVLGNAFARMVEQLSQLIARAQAAAESIAQASEQVSAGNEDLSQRTSEQASSLEETASSMEEMTSTVKQNADNARQANQLAGQARDVAEKGGSVVNQAVSSMDEINKASKRITDIISVIDEIAFQTNLLALNAAVEAARVGEQGRGFAVVAAEVRNLAGRSATAAKEIKALVQDSVHKVEEGSELVNQSGQQLDEIVSSVKKVADIIAEISAASQEQSAGIEQVNKAVLQMDQITQQNAALVEEAAAASQSMSQRAVELQGLVAQFRVEEMTINSIRQQIAMQHARDVAGHKAAKATGTDGTAGGWKSGSGRKPKLEISSNEENEFETF